MTEYKQEVANTAANTELKVDDAGTLLAPAKEPEPRYEYKFVKGAKVKVRIN